MGLGWGKCNLGESMNQDICVQGALTQSTARKIGEH